MSESAARGSVLIVSEDVRLLERVRSGLEPVYRLRNALDVVAARELLRETGFDVVLALHPMHADSGLKLLTELAQQRHPAIRVLATSIEDKKVLGVAINEGRVSYILRSPWTSDALRDVIDSLLELRVRQQSRVRRIITPDSTGSFKEGFTGVLPLPAFFRQLQAKLASAGATTMTLLAAEVDYPRRLHPPEGEENLTNLRFLSACVKEASNPIAGAVVARSGGQILALLPDCTEAVAFGVARHAQNNFARADAGARSSASFGFATYPRHAPDTLSLMDRVAEALQRAQQQGFGQITESLPRVCVVGPLQPLRQAIELLARRDDLVLLVYESPTSAELVREQPAVVLINVQASRSLVDQLHNLKLVSGRPPRTIFATLRDDSPQVRARVSAVPGATLISGEDRFTPRVVESVSAALGVKLRRSLRFEACAPLTVMLGPETPLQQRMPAELLNISESGALIALTELVHPGETLRVELAWGERTVVLPAHVVRQARVEPRWECGIRFDELSADDAEVVGLFIAHAGVAPRPPQPGPEGPSAAPMRTGVRYLPARFHRFKVKLSRQGSAERWYLKVVNLSEGGLLASATAGVAPAVEEGETVEVVVMDVRGATRSTAQVVRRFQSSAGLWQVALRFIQLDRRARTELARMLAHCEATDRRDAKQQAHAS